MAEDTKSKPKASDFSATSGAWGDQDVDDEQPEPEKHDKPSAGSDVNEQGDEDSHRESLEKARDNDRPPRREYNDRGRGRGAPRGRGGYDRDRGNYTDRGGRTGFRDREYNNRDRDRSDRGDRRGGYYDRDRRDDRSRDRPRESRRDLGDNTDNRDRDSEPREPREPRPKLPVPEVPPFKAFVGNLDYSVDERDLNDYFDSSLIERIHMLKGAENKFKGSCFIEFKDKVSLENALKKDGSNMYNRLIKVDVAEDKPERRRNNAGRRDYRRDDRSDNRSEARPDPRSDAREDANTPETNSSENKETTPKERKKLALAPRTVPRSENPVTDAGQLSPVAPAASLAVAKPKPNPFGEAIPRELNLKKRGVKETTSVEESAPAASSDTEKPPTTSEDNKDDSKDHLETDRKPVRGRGRGRGQDRDVDRKPVGKPDMDKERKTRPGRGRGQLTEAERQRQARTGIVSNRPSRGRGSTRDRVSAKPGNKGDRVRNPVNEAPRPSPDADKSSKIVKASKDAPKEEPRGNTYDILNEDDDGEKEVDAEADVEADVEVETEDVENDDTA